MYTCHEVVKFIYTANHYTKDFMVSFVNLVSTLSLALPPVTQHDMCLEMDSCMRK